MTEEKPTDLFPIRLKTARELRKFSQAELAERARLPPTSIAHFESGSRKPSFDNLRRLADALSVTADYLLARVEELEAFTGTDRLHRHAHNLSGQDLELLANFTELLANRNKKP